MLADVIHRMQVSERTGECEKGKEESETGLSQRRQIVSGRKGARAKACLYSDRCRNSHWAERLTVEKMKM